MRHFGNDAWQIFPGCQVEVDDGFASGGNFIAQERRQGVDQAAFNPV